MTTSLIDPTNARNVHSDFFMEIVDDRIRCLEARQRWAEKANDGRLRQVNLDEIARYFGVPPEQVETVFSPEEILAF